MSCPTITNSTTADATICASLDKCWVVHVGALAGGGSRVVAWMVLEHVRQNCAQLPSALRVDGAAAPHCSSVDSA